MKLPMALDAEFFDILLRTIERFFPERLVPAKNGTAGQLNPYEELKFALLRD